MRKDSASLDLLYFLKSIRSDVFFPSENDGISDISLQYYEYSVWRTINFKGKPPNWITYYGFGLLKQAINVIFTFSASELRSAAPEDSCDLRAHMNTISVQCIVHVYCAQLCRIYFIIWHQDFGTAGGCRTQDFSGSAALYDGFGWRFLVPGVTMAYEDDKKFTFMAPLLRMVAQWHHGYGRRPNGTMSLGWRLHIHMGPRLRMTIKYSDGTKARMRRIFRISSIWPRSWASFLLSLHHLSSGGGGGGGCIPESLYGVTLCGKPICSQGRLRQEFSAI